MLGGWFGRQALKKFLGASDFMARGASGQTKSAYKLSLTLVCSPNLISGHLDRFYQGSSQFGRMLWFYLVMNQGRYFAISDVAEGTLTLLAPCGSLSVGCGLKTTFRARKTTVHVINSLIWTSRGWVVQRAGLIFKNRHRFHFSQIGYPLKKSRNGSEMVVPRVKRCFSRLLIVPHMVSLEQLLERSAQTNGK
jgi:hypothetical protein